MNRFFYEKILPAGLSVMMMASGMPLSQAAAADPAPKIEIQTLSLEDTLPEDRIVMVEVSLSDNRSGFRAASFGIQYDASLVYEKAEAASAAGQAFQIVSNPEQHLLWLTGASASKNDASSLAAKETMLRLYFQVPEDGAMYPIQFVWEGVDGSPAYWYADKGSNVIETVQETAKNGAIKKPGISDISSHELRMNPGQSSTLQVNNATDAVIWFSSDESVAEVEMTGSAECVVTANAPGECDIQAFIDNEFLTCHVTVNAGYYYSIKEKADLNLVNPKNIIMEYPDAPGTVTWNSAKPKFVTIDNDGRLTFVQEGTDFDAYLFGTCNNVTFMRKIIVSYTEEPPTETEPPVTETEPPATEAPERNPGDANQDNKINILDVITVNKAVLGKENLSGQGLTNIDFNGNGKPDSEEALTIMKCIVGMIDKTTLFG